MAMTWRAIRACPLLATSRDAVLLTNRGLCVRVDDVAGNLRRAVSTTWRAATGRPYLAAASPPAPPPAVCVVVNSAATRAAAAATQGLTLVQLSAQHKRFW
jgi:hypothetical protein